MNKIWNIIVILLLSFYINAQVTITFQNPTYKNEYLYLLCEKDFITKEYDTLTTFKVDTAGKASIKINIRKACWIKFPLFRNEVWLFVEPDKQYKIKVPNKQYLTIEDSLNAYFTPNTFYAILESNDSTEMQEAVIRLDYSIDTLVNKHIQYLHFKFKRKYVDSLLNNLVKHYESIKSPYFQQHLFYKIVLLKYLSYERDQNYIIKYYFNDKAVIFNLTNQAYADVFNQVFNDFLSYYAASYWGKNIEMIINKLKSFSELRKAFKYNPAFTNDTLIDLVIIKGLHDAYFTNDLPNKVKFSKSSIMTIIDSLIQYSKIKDISQIANNVKQKLINKSIYIAYENYPFLNEDEQEIYLTAFRGKYIYLSIQDARAYNFYTDLKKQKAVFNRFKNKIYLINIVLNGSKQKLLALKEQEQLFNVFLFCKDADDFKNKLKIKSLPLYVLLAPDGQIINENAPEPDERIIPYIKEIIKE